MCVDTNRNIVSPCMLFVFVPILCSWFLLTTSFLPSKTYCWKHTSLCRLCPSFVLLLFRLFRLHQDGLEVFDSLGGYCLLCCQLGSCFWCLLARSRSALRLSACTLLVRRLSTWRFWLSGCSLVVGWLGISPLSSCRLADCQLGGCCSEVEAVGSEVVGSEHVSLDSYIIGLICSIV